MFRIIDGTKYLMRDTRPVKELRRLHAEFCRKFKSAMPFRQWLRERGKVHLAVKE